MIVYFFFFTVSVFFPDSFRVSNMHTHVFTTEVFDPISLSLGYNDAVSFAIKSDFLFLEGIELEIKQDKINMKYPNSIAYTLYTDIKPEPSKKNIDYSGQKLSTALLPNKFLYVIRIPVKSNYSFEGIKNGALLQYQRKITVAPFMLRFNPIMKGLPEDFEKANFTVTARPLLIAEGGLKIKLHFPEKKQKPVSVRIDNNYLTHFEDLQLLSPGTYSVNVSSDDYRTEMRSCTVERGKITRLDITLQSIMPLLRIQTPENMTVILDGQEIAPAKEPIPIKTGSHTVIFKLGTYQLTRQITVEEGKTYELTMTMEVLLQEVSQ